MKKLIHIVIVLLLPVTLAAQVGSITPVLVGSAGNFSSAGNISLSASVGEPMVVTANAPTMILTQGFQQPTSDGGLTAGIIFTNVSCLNANDGTATVIPGGGAAPYTYVWTSSPSDTLAFNDSLVPGTYTVTVNDASGLTITQTVTITDAGGLCGVHVYSGLTPNGDGKNDIWLIDYLELFQPNNVYIYNRWGALVWQGDNYNNQTVVWTGLDSQGRELADATYFYIIQVGQETMKGWVELSH
jgi:gliding motility-associated-like protein